MSAPEKNTFWACAGGWMLDAMEQMFSFAIPAIIASFLFAYNFGRGIAALNPWFVGLLSAILPLGPSMGGLRPCRLRPPRHCSVAAPETRVVC